MITFCKPTFRFTLHHIPQEDVELINMFLRFVISILTTLLTLIYYFFRIFSFGYYYCISSYTVLENKK